MNYIYPPSLILWISLLYLSACIEDPIASLEFEPTQDQSSSDATISDLQFMADLGDNNLDLTISRLDLEPPRLDSEIPIPDLELPDLGVPIPESCNRRDDDQDGIIDEGYILREVEVPLFIEQTSALQILSTPYLLPLPNQEWYALWEQSPGDGRVPQVFGRHIHQQNMPSISTEVPLSTRFAQWYNVEYEMVATRECKFGIFNMLTQDVVTSLRSVNNTECDQHAVGFWSGEKHIIITTHTDDEQENQNIVYISTFNRDGTSALQLPPITVHAIQGAITVAQGDDLNMIIWGSSDPNNNSPNLHAILLDASGNLVNQIQIPDVKYRLTNGKSNWQVAQMGNKWLIVTPMQSTVESAGFMAITLNRDGSRIRRYLVASDKTLDQLSLAISDQLAIVAGREPNGQVNLWSLAHDQMISMTPFERADRFDIQLIDNKLFILSFMLINGEKTLTLSNFECVAE